MTEMDKNKNNTKTGAPEAGQRTYGVNLMEWHALIPAGFGVVRIRFTGGAYSGYGQKPASYTTDNPVIIKLIEDSSYYKSGMIFKIR